MYTIGKPFLSNMKMLNKRVEEMEIVNAFSAFRKFLMKIHSKASQIT